MKQTIKAFSLIEILVGILIISGVMLAAFQTLGAVGIGKVKLIERTNIEKQSYYMAEKFYEMIKKGGTLDYEEYWNRTSYNTTIVAGKYSQNSGFGNYGHSSTIGNSSATNFGALPYSCISNSGNMGTNGCLTGKNISYNLAATNTNKANTPQRYTQYELQFIDRNSDNDIDNGDEDGDGSIIGDYDDLYLGQGPIAFSGNKVQELYLISPSGTERTYFRWNVVTDPNKPSSVSCSFANPANPTGEGCLGNIEFLKLIGGDDGYQHALSGPGLSDGIIDTWYIHPDFTPSSTRVVAGSNTVNYWQPVFPDAVNVSNVEFYAFPNKSIKLAWKESLPEYQIAPYVQIKMTLAPSWKQKRKIAGEIPTVDFLTTITLTDLDFR